MDVKRDISEDLPLGGFAAAVGGYARKPLDLNELLVRNPPATFFARMSGDDMTGMGIGDGDILVVDRSADPKDGDIVVLYVENEFLARRIRGVKDGKIILESDDGRAGKKTTREPPPHYSMKKMGANGFLFPRPKNYAMIT